MCTGPALISSTYPSTPILVDESDVGMHTCSSKTQEAVVGSSCQS